MQPRIETTVLIRSISGTPVHVRLVSVEVRASQNITVSSKLGSTDTNREYRVCQDPFAFRPAGGAQTESVIGIDLPVLLSIPSDSFPSGIFAGCNASTTHSFMVSVIYGANADIESTHTELFPFALKLYDTLPLYRQYNEPLKSSHSLLDGLVVIDVTMPVLLIGPLDEFVVECRILANPAKQRHRSTKLTKLTLQLQEIIECHEGGLVPFRETKILTTSRGFDEPVTNMGILHTFKVRFPHRNEHLHMYHPPTFHPPQETTDESDQVLSINLARTERPSKLTAGVPLTHTQGFTTTGRLFSIRFEAVLKLKLSHSKDTEVRLPVTVCPYDRQSSGYLLRWIMKECEAARTRFGREVVNEMTRSRTDYDINRCLAPFVYPPTAYHWNKSDWILMGYEPDLFEDRHAPSFFLRHID